MSPHEDDMELNSTRNGVERRLLQGVKGLIRFFTSRRCIPMLKGVLAFEIMIILVFLSGFEKLAKFPTTLSSMPIMILGCFPGRAIGESIQATLAALVGVGCGAVGFVILANLHGQPVAQGFVFFIFVYVFALVKVQGSRSFVVALLSILVAFQGIYTSELQGRYESQYIIDFIKSYCWGAAIAIAVSVLVLPVSSEQELRRALVASLQHISGFGRLLSNAYTLRLTERDQATRNTFAQTVRADFGFLTQKVDQITMEFGLSKFSVKDYRSFVQRIRAIQQALITSDSSLRGVDERDVELIKEKFIPETTTSFAHLRAALRSTIRDIHESLGGQMGELETSQAVYVDLLHMQRSVSSDALDQAQLGDQFRWHLDFEEHGTQSSSFYEDVTNRVEALIEQGIWNVDENNADNDSVLVEMTNGQHDATVSSINPKPSQVTFDENPTIVSIDSDATELRVLEEPGVPMKDIIALRKTYDKFAARQRRILADTVKHGIYGGGADLHFLRPSPSLYDKFTPAPWKKASRALLRRRRLILSNDESSAHSTLDSDTDSDTETVSQLEATKRKRDSSVISSHHSLVRVYSFIFSLEQIVTELEALHRDVTSVEIRRLRFHAFENLYYLYHRFRTSDGSWIQARTTGSRDWIALLEGKGRERKRETLIQRLETVERWFRRPNSLFALKTAAAASALITLLLVKRTQGFFISYGLSGGTLTIITALSPTLGQSMVSWLIQVAGSGIGYVYAAIVLEIFRNVGGYHFNPYGVTTLLLPFIMVGMFILYERPRLFIAGLLGLNAAGVLVITEWVNVAVLGKVNFDGPALRLAKSLTTLSIALGIAIFFQLFILRNPARKGLRLAVTKLLFSQMEHMNLLQVYGRTLNPGPHERQADPDAIKQVEREMRRRELQMQTDLIQLQPLLVFASLEPTFTKPFHGSIYTRLIRAMQVIHDRMRDARTAVGTEQLPDVVLRDFTPVLVPYRRQNSQRILTSFYLSASSMLSKVPMPSDTNPMTTGSFFHDLLVLSNRFVNTPEGEASLRSGDFTRYFHYHMCMASLGENLKDVEDACKELFGELEQQLELPPI